MSRPAKLIAAKFAATAIVALLAWLFLWPAILGGSMTYVVVSGPSMEPTYRTGDFVAARAQDGYQAGDIVVFSTGNGNVVHRIVDGDGDSGYLMQGDNNPEIDRWTPTDEDVLGKAVLHVPDAGNWVLLIRHVLITPPFPYLLAGFVFLLAILGDGKKGRRHTESLPSHSDEPENPSDEPGRGKAKKRQVPA